jgi:transposase
MSFQQGGVEALRARKAPGAPRRLMEPQLQRLEKLIRAGPEACGLDTGVWTAPKVAQVIWDRFRVQYSASQVRRILITLGFSLQYPKRILSEAQLADQRKWLNVEYPAIKKKPTKKEVSSSSRTR